MTMEVFIHFTLSSSLKLWLLNGLFLLSQPRSVYNAAIPRPAAIPKGPDVPQRAVGPVKDDRLGAPILGALGPRGAMEDRIDKLVLKHKNENDQNRVEGVHALGGAGDDDRPLLPAALGPGLDAEKVNLQRPPGAIGPGSLARERHQLEDNLPRPAPPAAQKNYLHAERKLRPKFVKNDLKPDHLDGVRIHQDGDLNRDYKREIFLGIDDHHGHVSDDDAEAVLTRIFKLADTDGDKYLSINEMTKWIIKKIDDHFQEASVDNNKIFNLLDTNSDGYLKWEEFRNEYIQAMGYKLEPDDVVQKLGFDLAYHLTANDKLNLELYESRWQRSDTAPEDQQLSAVEFQAFRHPEKNQDTLNELVNELVENFDTNHDALITEDEFAALPPGEVEEQFRQSDREWVAERRREFRRVVDINQDGHSDVKELLLYVDPRNRSHARLEAENLVGSADTDDDGRLTLREILDNSVIFLGSKMVNTGRSFHDEF